MDKKLATLTISQESSSTFGDFISIVDDIKKRKQKNQMLDVLISDNQFESLANTWLTNVYDGKDMMMLKKVSSFLESSVVTRKSIAVCFDAHLKYLDTILELVVDQDNFSVLFTSIESFQEQAVLAVKVCLQTIQFLPEKIREAKEKKEDMKDVLESVCNNIVIAMCDKRFSKDCCLLAGTAFALLFNLFKDDFTISNNISNFVHMLAYRLDKEEKRNLRVSSLAINFPGSVTSHFAQLSVINGLLNTTSEILFLLTENGDTLLHTFFKLLVGSNLTTTDATAKYFCFQSLNSWANFLSNGKSKASPDINRNERLLKFLHVQNIALFLKKDSLYMKPLLSIVWRYVEDLVDGIPQFVQKLLSTILKLHMDEVVLHETKIVDQFYIDLTKEILAQAWHVKGRWILLAEMIPYVGYEKLFQSHTMIADELSWCMKTCGLASVSNEVYQKILQDIKQRYSSDIDLATTKWLKIFGETILKHLQSDNFLMRQNIGIYWIPTTLRILPSCLNVIENEINLNLLNNLTSDNVLHAYMLILKCASNFGLMTSDKMMKRQVFLEEALFHSSDDIRADALSILCNNPKRTEPFSPTFQNLVLQFILNNLNSDSSKFRQQVFSSLKRLLINIRDSSVVLHRKMSKEKNGSKSFNILTTLVDFVDNIFKISRTCLIPSASFQRKKTGLQLMELLSDLFVYVQDLKFRRKGAATENALPLFEFVTKSFPLKWNMMTVDFELLSCIEDQHDEIRNLALKVLTYHHNVSAEKNLLDKKFFDKLLKVGLNLLNSSKFYETESGSTIIAFLMNRLINDDYIKSHMSDFMNDARMEFDCEQNAPILLCNFILQRAKQAFGEAKKDLLRAACFQPVYGLSLALSVCLNSLSNVLLQKSTFLKFIKELLQYSDAVSETMIQLFCGAHHIEMDAVSPSFADIDEALDQIIKTCDSYKDIKSTVGHLHCREVFVSFCWLNLKALSIVMTEIGSLLAKKKNEYLILTPNDLEIVLNFYVRTLIKCRHKGVIENCYASLSYFAKCIADVPQYWKFVSKRCSDVLVTATDLKKHGSVTKRSAGIPLFIQAIISAESASHGFELLNTCIKNLFAVAQLELPKVINTTYDLPQFNAINILRAIFRDTSLGNTVLQFVEEGIMLTIDGFSSQSWSIRNASTTLLGTLVPRMLGQRLSQEESSQQNASTTDVFFYRYPRLEHYFLNCLKKQLVYMKESGCVATLPHVVPVLTFLSKLRCGESKTSMSEMYTYVLRAMKDSAVFVVRDLVASSLLAFVPKKCYESLCKDIVNEMVNGISRNGIHTYFLVLYKLSEHIEIQLVPELPNLLENQIFNTHLFAQSLTLDMMIKHYEAFKTDEILDLLKNFTKKTLMSLQKMKNIAIGKVFLEKSLTHAVVTTILNSNDTSVLNLLIEFGSTDLHTLLFGFARQYIPEEKELHINSLSCFAIHVILTSGNKNLLESALKFLNCLNNNKVFLGSIDCVSFYHRLLNLSTLLPGMWPSVLPTISVVVVFLLEENDEKFSLDVNHVSQMILKFSSAENSEDLRLSVALSLAVFKPLFKLHEEGDCEYYTASIESLLTASLRLLQDEDETVRQQANTSLNFLNHLADVNCKTKMQSNRTLESLFAVVASRKNKCYLKWLTSVIIYQHKDTSEESDLILFEQESMNLYQEEVVVIELSFKYWEIAKQISLQSCSDEDFLVIQEDIVKTCKSIISKLLQFEKCCTAAIERSTYGLFGHRKNFTKCYRLLKLLLLLSDFGNLKNTAAVEIDEFSKFLKETSGKYTLPSVLQSLIGSYFERIKAKV
ncbi:thyroid adenoma-associated protein homolog isoform X2 [Hydractinia symbiolongicarpus]|uniref:thyroid adenoma-associated protein homolog isoform X2 n=1 Tax=Hydractinia symbiolongicarpus TaxID=13093 RepID=UPI00254C4430|nr:thyroid adenoma-associated protein homolog isoform X2 [Hydractinia symbiolongicarpus]